MPARSVKDQCLPPSMRVSYVPLLMPVLALLMMKTSLNLTAF
jgi:hypothetical protein